MSTPVIHRGTASAPPPSLAQRNFPRRVRMLLEGVLKLVSDDIERGLSNALNETEQQLFKMAEQARSNEVQQHCFEALREVKRSRGDLVPRFLIGLEASLAVVQDPHIVAAVDDGPKAGELSLVDVVEVDEMTVLREIATRAEIGNSLSLFLLGQRMGVIAGRPAFDSDTIPIGPHALCRILRDAAGCLGIGEQDRVVLFRQFERQVLTHTSLLLDTLNDYLVKQGVLPTLTFVPVRAQRSPAAPEPEAGPAPNESEDRRKRRGAPMSPPPAMASRPAAPARKNGTSEADLQSFEALRQLLSGKRNLLGKLGGGRSGGAPEITASLNDVQAGLGMLQARPATSTVTDGVARPRTVRQVKQDLLVQLRRNAPAGKAPQLNEEDNDTFELVGLLFENLMQDVRPSSPAADLLTRMQVPLLRVALQDKSFFTQREHPAREMLASIAETGAQWVGDDDVDRTLIDKLRVLVDRVSNEFDGDQNMLTGMVSDISKHLQTVQRKADVAERRHVEAARGREKLELSRLQAAEAIDRLLKDKPVPKFLHTLLAQAWTDVLALTLLRKGADSDTFRLQQHVAQRLIESAASSAADGESVIGPTEAASLREDIEQALGQVGYHVDDAKAVSTRLLALSQDEANDDPASRTELTVRLKSRSRLGSSVTGDDGKAVSDRDLSEGEKKQLEMLRKIPFGTWMDFTVNQQGDKVRRRLSWYSTVTGHSLFVNQRGQRAGEYSMRWLARELDRGNVSIVQPEKGNMIDRAWGRIMSALRSFAGGGKNAAAAVGQGATP
ncbi:MAG: DUF1631 domain-containing protein [Xanthomonadales bacterium]|nr:DUF1631 domain-containing protein [Xanthomonadales bacterium]